MEHAARQAAIDILTEHGFQGVTFQRVAERAGVGQPALYRRWASKGEMVEDAIFPVADWDPPTSVGSLAADLRGLVRGILTSLMSPPVRAAIPGLLVTYHEDPSRHDRLVARAESPVREVFRAMLDAAVERGEASTEVDPDTLFDVVLGAAMYQTLVRNTSDIEAATSTIATVIEHATGSTRALS